MATDNSNTSHFTGALIAEILSSCKRFELNNFDELRFEKPPTPPLGQRLRTAIKIGLARRGFHQIPAAANTSLLDLDLANTYDLLADPNSKELFVKLIAYRLLGYQRVKLPLNNERYETCKEQAQRSVEERKTITGIPELGSLDLYSWNGIKLHAHTANILCCFILEQYRYPAADVGVQPGDVVIDAGGCWGDSALYFAQQGAGKVFCFECMPTNLEICRKNLALNDRLSGRIELIPAALWESARTLVFAEAGAGSKPNKDGITVSAETIDNFVSLKQLDRLDFIKMDIEGSELRALKGGEESIRRFRPDLAISIYHKPEDLVEIPRWIDSLGLGYRFHIDHFTIHAEETVLFASDGHRTRP